MSELGAPAVDISDLTDETVLKILIERGRAAIIAERKQAVITEKAHADGLAENQHIMDYIKKYGTDEG